MANPEKMPRFAAVEKAVEAMYEIANDPHAPFRVPLGIDALAVVKKELDAHLEEVKLAGKYSSHFSYEKGANPFVEGS